MRLGLAIALLCGLSTQAATQTKDPEFTLGQEVVCVDVLAHKELLNSNETYSETPVSLYIKIAQHYHIRGMKRDEYGVLTVWLNEVPDRGSNDGGYFAFRFQPLLMN